MRKILIQFSVSCIFLASLGLATNVIAQETLQCGTLGCNGDTMPCEEGTVCTYRGDALCGQPSGTVCVPNDSIQGTSGNIIPGTTYLGSEFERTFCTTIDNSNNYLYHISDPNRTWSQQEILDLVCNPDNTTTDNTNTDQTDTNTDMNTTNNQTPQTNQVLPKTSVSNSSIVPTVFISIISILIIATGVSLRLKSR